MVEDLDSLSKSASEDKTLDRYDDDDFGDFGDFGDFKLPDLGVSLY